ncbi:hypothetical protein KC19_9G099000 [Ceratodon purpureus]|uniref:Pectate lyase n=1 Tax=Ceratodon purpureus TaxID=3225 RepID=A0A8T0GTI5_CERPU|nr:hypothetical protein KC19_9G099000 [Ceratodon purpureus]
MATSKMRIVVLMAMAAMLLLSVQVLAGEAIVASTDTIVTPAEVVVSSEELTTVKVPTAAPAKDEVVVLSEEPATDEKPAAAPDSTDSFAAVTTTSSLSESTLDGSVVVDNSTDSFAEVTTTSSLSESTLDGSVVVDNSTDSFAEVTTTSSLSESTLDGSVVVENSTDSFPEVTTTSLSDDTIDGTYDSYAEEGNLMSDDGDLSFAGEQSFDGSYPEEASFADLPDGDDADAEQLDFGLADEDTVRPYDESFFDESAATSGVPPGFDVDETGETGNATDSTSDDSELSLASSGGGCQTGNPIDDCWRCDGNWAAHRQSLANCAQGFGKCAIGGRNGPLYWVTSPRDDDPANPAPGTLRYAVTRPGPLWIVFKSSMTIKLKGELMVTSYKTIDGRGVTVHIAGGAGITLQRVSNVIVHGLYIHDVFPTGPGKIMTSTNHVGNRGRADGDAISVFSSKCIWIDHCYFARGKDGLVDVIRGSSMVTISNSFFTQHDKVILLGAHKDDYMDRDMKVTIMLNIFGPGLVQRMPRVRFGTAHVVNNDYTSGWGIYAIGGSEAPVLNCEGNLFQPGRGPKGVAKKVWDGGGMYGGPKTWPWRATGNEYRGGAFFQTSGPQTGQVYAKATSCSARPVYMVERMTRSAGPLKCRPGSRC